MNTLQATRKAKETVVEITGKDAESVSRCERDDKVWTIVLDIIESKARIADNDVIASYELILDLAGDLQRYMRLRRYRRADARNETESRG
ncbi:hypothetical protein CCR94_19275 [Rhodoblastus sphagnicola]|jgi:hypothetical protein|uniref:Gas vesicle protein n=1 Tax=Rhodoblastus sphagnicola TaxID=333368 RepID=A0A2S6MZN9_9HYPH|nr:gas vesicle protein GvpO [Rhodoblastus sphagnicola]MBB4200734.1 hypothetical protein [Rhodoblastus sphagnicola]PPQ27808.1 hypothetical protein CCR94_19275 [Rhodoblastus sphagnicola]